MLSAPSPMNGVFRDKVAKLVDLQRRLPESPYSVILRLQLSSAYQSLGYPDLAAGDAYKALLLVDEIVQDGEYHEEALEAAEIDVASEPTCNTGLLNKVLLQSECICRSSARESDPPDDHEAFVRAKSCWSITAYTILIACLIECGSLRSAYDYNARATRAYSDNIIFKSYQEEIKTKLHSHFEKKGESFDDVDVLDYPDKGRVRRELYPWNNNEPDRYTSESIEYLSSELATIAPKLEIKVASLPVLTTGKTTASGPLQSSEATVVHVNQLGLFAKEDIVPGDEILKEKSLLTAVARLHESYCDACSAPLPKAGADGAVPDEQEVIVSCEECEEVYFCGSECQELAQDHYHPALCGVDVEQKASPSEAADSLYSLLLIRALALAEVQDVHPLELREVRYIWGDYHGLDLDKTWKPDSPFGSVIQTLPFSFKDNILTPLHMLEKMDVNIFEQSHRYDTWVFNTLYAKFRGTASARQGLDGRPEIGAVHPIWCLANHSCDPNVTWEWRGSMRFWARKEMVKWSGKESSQQPGIRKGQEILSHYCDIRLPVKERREWAVGALGGDCMCPRCVWEEAEGGV